MTDSDVAMACHLAVLKALSHATNMSPATGRSNGRELVEKDGTPKWMIHTRVQLAANDTECDRLLTGAWDLLTAVLPIEDAGRVVNACDRYTRDLILTQRPPQRTAIAQAVDAQPAPAR